MQWLIANNIYYHNIQIDNSVLESLPHDDELTNLPTFSSDTISETTEQSSDLEDVIPQTFIPMNYPRETQCNIIMQSLNSTTDANPSHRTITWPQLGTVPVNEFTTEGYISAAFPTLFPTGAADFTAPRDRKVTIGNYFKHLMFYHDGRFARHPRFRYYALNTQMRHRALQTGRIYVKQHPNDAHLSTEDLREMVHHGGESLANRVQHFGYNIHGTRAYWFSQRSRLIAMIDSLGLPTIFFTHSAADTQWPELANLISPADVISQTSRVQAVNQNPAVADWFFYKRIQYFINDYYVGVLKTVDYWYRLEWQHRGSPHVHGLAWLPNAPDVQSIVTNDVVTSEYITSIDQLVTTINPAIQLDGSNYQEAPPPQTNPHICNKPYGDVENYLQDYIDLVATCQRHTRCSPSYCLRSQAGQQECRFGYPKPLQVATAVTNTTGDIELMTARNDPLINSHNPVQLSAWRANVDMQYCVSKQRVLDYCAKYATKSEPRSQPLKDLYKSIVAQMSDGNHALKLIQKLLINTVADRDYSAQETCHLLMQLPLCNASREFVILALDGSRVIREQLLQGERATEPSILDHYKSRPHTPEFNDMTLLHFVENYKMPMGTSQVQPMRRSKPVVVIVRPYYPPDANGPNYDNYCRHKLMLHVPYRELNNLIGEFDSYTLAYENFLQTNTIPKSLNNDLYHLQQRTSIQTQDHIDQPSTSRATEEWMLICQLTTQLQSDNNTSTQQFNWRDTASRYSNIEETCTFISRHRQNFIPGPFNTTADPQ